MRINDDVALSYDDVLLVPKRGVLEHRANANISSILVHGSALPVPILSAPMSSVTEGRMARAMYDVGGMGVIHRFMTIEKQIEEFIVSHNAICALGLEDGIDRTYRIGNRTGCYLYMLDVAHAHSNAVLDFVKLWKNTFSGDLMKLIVGNIATRQAAADLCVAGADGVKVGIGPGAACTTREVTGFGVPQLTAVMDVADELKGRDVTVIADGGIKNSGDIVKALAAGANSVMVGRLLAGADEAPKPGEYFGMASKRVNGHNAPEGIEGFVAATGPAAETIKSLAWGIRSGVSYSGGTDLAGLRWNAEFMRVSPLSRLESNTRI